MAEPDVTLTGVEGRGVAQGTEGSPGTIDDPRRAYARRERDLISFDTEVGVEALRGEAALSSLLERLTPVFEDAIVGLAVLRVDGTVMRANKALASILGRRRGELEGLNWRNLVGFLQAAEVQEQLARAIESGSTTFEVYGRFTRPDGEERWALVNFSTVSDADLVTVGLLGQVHDITYPMRLEESQRATEAELELRRAIAVAANEAEVMEDAMSAALVRLCEHTGWPVGHIYLSTADGKLMSTGIWHLADWRYRAIQESLRFGTFNPRLSPPGQVLASRTAMWLGDSATAQGFAAAETARDRGLTGWAGFPIIAGTECVGVMEFYAALPTQQDLHLTEMMTDVGTQLGRVMERRRSEDERTEILLREQFLTAWFRSLLQSTEEGICGLDLDGKVSFVNRAGADLLGYTPEELQGKSLHDTSHHTRVDGTPYPNSDCPILRASRTGVGVRVDSEVFWHRDGTPFSVEYSSHAIVDLGGDIKGTVLTFTDITERRREEQAARTLNQALLTTKDELERANLLKSDFLATMSHELRTPLNAIMGFAGLMQNGLAGAVTDTGADYLERINRNAQVLLALINDVLDLSRIEANRMPLSPRVLDVTGVVRQVVENMQSLADNKGLVLEMHDLTTDPVVMAHQRAVHQVVTNLLSNAIKFTDKGSVTVQVKNEGNGVMIEVIDTGMGIAADEQALVFEAFRQVGAHARTGTGGTGLGLAISKRLARELGGELSVTSDVGAGSRFALRLVSALVSPGLLQEAGPAPLPVVMWLTSDYQSTQRIRDWAGEIGLGFVGLVSTELVVKAAVEMRPAVIALDVSAELVGDMVARIKEESKLTALPLLVVSDSEVPDLELYPNVWQMRRPFGRAQLHNALQYVRPSLEAATDR